MTNVNPKRRADILVEGSADEAMLYQPDRDELHVLNPTAQLIWELCDGSHSVNDMVGAVRSRFAAPPEVNILVDVERTVAEFREKQLLEV